MSAAGWTPWRSATEPIRLRASGRSSGGPTGISSPAAARMFRLLGLHPGPEMSRPAAGSLAAVQPDQARQALSELVAAQLLTRSRPVALPFTTWSALTLASWLRRRRAKPTVAQPAAGCLITTCIPLTLPTSFCTRATESSLPRSPSDQPEFFTSDGEALSWLLAERRVLVTAVAKAAETGFDTHSLAAAAALAGFLGREGDWREWADTQQTALAAAQRLDQPTAPGGIASWTGRGLDLARRVPGRRVPSATRADLVPSAWRSVRRGQMPVQPRPSASEQGQLDEALRRHEDALSIHRDLDDKTEVAWALNAVGWVHAITGNCQLASSYCQSALACHRELDDCFGQACTLHSLAYVRGKTGRHAEAGASIRTPSFFSIGSATAITEALTDDPSRRGLLRRWSGRSSTTKLAAGGDHSDRPATSAGR